MGKRVHKVRYHLDAKNIKQLSQDELHKILRAADPLIMRGGRSMLAKILKGSKDKKLLEHNFNTNPAYGFFKDLSIVDITAKIDWVILEGFLTIEYDYRLPLLVYTPIGWDIEKDIYADELLAGFGDMIDSGRQIFDMTYLKDRNREMINLLLDKVQATQDRKYIPILEAWAQIDYKKIQKRIRAIVKRLNRT